MPKEFTLHELFLNTPYPYAGYTCGECGALVSDQELHVSWHNKLMP